LNGDGKLEVIVQSFYYKGGQTTIYRCEPDEIEQVLSVGRVRSLRQGTVDNGCLSRHSLVGQNSLGEMLAAFY
jgi:hypothetical protein